MILEFITILILFILLDMIWFSISVSNIYTPAFTKIQGAPPSYRITGGLFAWVLLALGVYLFVLPMSKSSTDAFIYGAIFGLIVFGVYNGTNYATFKDWNMNIFLSDVIYGTAVTSIISLITYSIFKYK